MAYFIHKLDKNLYNHYKYHYLDHMVTVIDLRENYWSFAMDLYSINDFNLPLNSLVADLQLPYQEVKDINFNLSSDQSHAQEGVEHNKQYARLYTSTFNVDISQNEYLKQDLTNTRLNLELSLFIDPEAAKAAGDDINQEDLDSLMNETSEQRWDFVMYYTNTHLIKQNAVIDNVVGYTLPFGHECVPTTKSIRVSSDLLQDLNQSFNTLAKLSATNPFQILYAKVKFTYWIDPLLETKSLEKVLDIDHSIHDNISIELNDATRFNEESNEVIFDNTGIPGFYIPKYSHGYYELELHVQQDNTITKLIIRNEFNFNACQQKAFMAIVAKPIEQTDESWGWVIYD